MLHVCVTLVIHTCVLIAFGNICHSYMFSVNLSFRQRSMSFGVEGWSTFYPSSLAVVVGVVVVVVVACQQTSSPTRSNEIASETCYYDNWSERQC